MARTCLIADMDAYRRALGKGLDFTYSLCGRVPAPDELVASPALVSCPDCYTIIIEQLEVQQAAAAEEAAKEAAKETPAADAGAEGHVDEPEPDREPGGPVDPDVAPIEPPGSAVDTMMETFKSYVGSMVDDGGMMPDDELSAWVEGDEMVEAGAISPTDKEFLVQLNGMAGMLGILDLSRRVLSTLHRVRHIALEEGAITERPNKKIGEEAREAAPVAAEVEPVELLDFEVPGASTASDSEPLVPEASEVDDADMAPAASEE